jgi:ubiquitin carboxyl-terminal hydrolase 14
MLQQDAEECWSEILSVLRTTLKSTPTEKSFIDRYMSGTFRTSLSCDEAPEQEPVVQGTESFLKLNCHIDIHTNFMRNGIKAALTEHLEKRSEVLDRNATWTKSFEITRTPKYLVVHFVRFYWKRDTNKKAKILRKVKFPLELDITEFCSEQVKQKTLPIRDALREAKAKHEEAERARKRARVQAEVDSKDGTATFGTAGEKMDGVEEVDVEALIDESLKADEGSNPTGLYELSGVLTHAGSNADSGHWQAWVKQTQDSIVPPSFYFPPPFRADHPFPF